MRSETPPFRAHRCFSPVLNSVGTKVGGGFPTTLDDKESDDSFAHSTHIHTLTHALQAGRGCVQRQIPVLLWIAASIPSRRRIRGKGSPLLQKSSILSPKSAPPTSGVKVRSSNRSGVARFNILVTPNLRAPTSHRDRIFTGGLVCSQGSALSAGVLAGGGPDFFALSGLDLPYSPLEICRHCGSLVLASLFVSPSVVLLLN